MKPFLIGLWPAEPIAAHDVETNGHAGSHKEGFANECITVETHRGTLGMGFLLNRCSYPVNVKHAVHNAPGTDGENCRPREDSYFPCSTYVPANGRATAFVSDNRGRGKVETIACRFISESRTAGEDFVPKASSPNEYGCYHYWFGPNTKPRREPYFEEGQPKNPWGGTLGQNKTDQQKLSEARRAINERMDREGISEDEAVQRMVDDAMRALKNAQERGNYDPSLFRQ